MSVREMSISPVQWTWVNGRAYNSPQVNNQPAVRIGVEVITLSQRQKQVLSLLAEGLTDDGIGRRLGISARTARAHVEALKRKLGVERRREIPSAFHRLTGRDPFDEET